ncbi:hypothetical protein U9M48_032029 [Paspalum notatum var. saurae]|uniref:Uncharacterized protein n=1 Tax=Paspalum notatum var. saurae TaxID=547442 RepID=A0AAQ3X4Z3_PASNO
MAKIRSKLREDNAKCFRLGDQGILWFGKRLVVPKDFELRKLIIDESHNSQFAIHPGSNKMYHHLKQRFWWTHMKREIARYVSECDVCQKVRAEHLKPAGTLQPLPIPSWKWEDISTDFIIGLPKTQDAYNSIWVIVDRLTKSTHFPPVRTRYPVEKYAEPYITRIVCHHGVPTTIVSDRAEESVRLVQERQHAAQGRQKHYADRRRRELSFDLGDFVSLKVTPFKGIKRFQEKGKLAPRFVGPFKILARVGAVAYRKCIRVPTKVTNLEEIDLQPNLAYQEHPIRILDQAERKTRNKTTKFVKVQWSQHSEWEATWEQEDHIR